MFTSLLESNTTMLLSSLLELELDTTKTARGFPPGTFQAVHFVLTIPEEYMEMCKNKNFNSGLSTVCRWSIPQWYRQNWVDVSCHTPRRGGETPFMWVWMGEVAILAGMCHWQNQSQPMWMLLSDNYTFWWQSDQFWVQTLQLALGQLVHSGPATAGLITTELILKNLEAKHNNSDINEVQDAPNEVM